MRLRDGLRTLLELAEGRAREAGKRVAEGEIPHFRLMELSDLADALGSNVVELTSRVEDVVRNQKAGLETRLDPLFIDQAAADVVNYTAYLRERLKTGSSDAEGGT